MTVFFLAMPSKKIIGGDILEIVLSRYQFHSGFHIQRNSPIPSGPFAQLIKKYLSQLLIFSTSKLLPFVGQTPWSITEIH